MSKKETSFDTIKREQDYVDFLKKRLASSSYKLNVSFKEYEQTKRKYDKAKLKLKMLREGTWK